MDALNRNRSNRVRSLLEEPAYRISEAAAYLGISPTTLQSWTRGKKHGAARRVAQPIIKLASTSPPLLSFINLLEAHMVCAFRRKRIPFQKVRKALAYLNEKMPSPHPLVDHNFLTNGALDLVIQYLSSWIDVTGQQGQVGLLPLVRMYFERIERDSKGLPLKLYPFLRRGRRSDLSGEGSSRILIDPRISFGRPVLVGTGVPVEEIADRFQAGETTRDLATEYGVAPEEIEEAIRFQTAPAAA